MSGLQFFGQWTEGNGKENDIVVSSRVRLARNLEDLPFPSAFTKEHAKKVLERIAGVTAECLPDCRVLNFSDLPRVEREILAENHLISREHGENDSGALILNENGSLSLMVNEEDHLRIQCILSGLELEQALRMADEADDLLAEKLNFAYDSKLGYLTSCPTNVGTGMRASVMLHLPALAYSGNLPVVLRSLNKLGLAVRGVYGEGSEMAGNMVQISNQRTLGSREEEILDQVKRVTLQVVEQEKQERSRLMTEYRNKLADLTGRAYGILANAYSISTAEAVKLLSDLRFGIELGLHAQINKKALNRLLLSIYPAHLEARAGRTLNQTERDYCRAELLRKVLNKEEVL